MPDNNKDLEKETLAIMCKKSSTIVVALTLLLLAAAPATSGAQQQTQYQPSVGQPGKDVIWVPTPDELIAAMLDAAKVTPNDFVVDLGSGDGRIVIAAAKRGARAMGVEYNPDMVQLSKENALKAGVAGKATFVNGDIFEADFSKATVVTMYLLPDLNMKLRPKILEMKPGTRVVTNSFTMEDWEPDQTISEGGRTGYLWYVPAKVAGSWTWANAQLALKQNFQKIEGSLILNGKDVPIQNARLQGNHISFAVGTVQYSGLVTGNTITGTTKAGTGPEVKWTAEYRLPK